jgi:hypothetical protein
VFAAVVMMGLIDLGTLIGTSDPRYTWPVSLDVSWGALFTFQLAGAYAWIAARPHESLPALVQLVLSAGALALGAAAGSALEPLWVALPVAASAVLFARLLARPRHRLRPALRRPHWRFGALAAVGVALWTPYVLSCLAVSRSAHEPYITNGIDHWPVQAAAGGALAASAVVLALFPQARPLLRSCTALSAALIGVAMLAYPERGGATESQLWAIAVVVWAVLVALTPPSRPRPVSALVASSADGADEARDPRP